MTLLPPVLDASLGVSPTPVFTAWARCAGAYVFGGSGSNSCPAGSDRISTAAACEAAASATALIYDSSGYESSYPAGCYRWTSDGRVYFNRHITGGSDADSQPLCSPAGSAGIALPPSVATIRRRVSIGAFAAAVPASAAPTNIGETRAPMMALPSGTPTGVTGWGCFPRRAAGVSPSVTAWARCAGAYVFGESGSNSCPEGSVAIPTAAACEAAASATALAYDSSEYESGYPAGCYRVTDGDGDSLVFFNAHVTGGSNANSQPLCSPEGSACTPLPLDVATIRRRVSIGVFAAAAPTNLGDTRAPATARPSIAPFPSPSDAPADDGDEPAVSACGPPHYGVL